MHLELDLDIIIINNKILLYIIKVIDYLINLMQLFQYNFIYQSLTSQLKQVKTQIILEQVNKIEDYFNMQIYYYL